MNGCMYIMDDYIKARGRQLHMQNNGTPHFPVYFVQVFTVICTPRIYDRIKCQEEGEYINIHVVCGHVVQLMPCLE